MTATSTQKMVGRYLAAVRAIADTIRETSPTPIGPMYAASMNVMDLDTFNGIISRLESAELIKVSGGGEIATWIGPK